MSATEFLFAQSSSANSSAAALAGILYIGLIVLFVIGMWKTFEKANQPGWAAIVPIYNMIVLLNVAGKPIWWIILCFIPIVAIIPAVLVPISIARNFRRGTGFGIGLLFLPFIFYPILGLGDSQYDPEI